MGMPEEAVGVAAVRGALVPDAEVRLGKSADRAARDPTSAEFAALVEEGREEEAAALRCREELGAKVRGAEMAPGEEPPSVSRSLRSLIVADQWADEETAKMIHEVRCRVAAVEEDASPGTLRIADDLALEQRYIGSDSERHWRLVLPASGGPGGGLGWRRFLFLHVHSGPFGGHRSGTATKELLKRLVYWTGMDSDVQGWVDSCWVCLKFRKVVPKVTAKWGVSRFRLPFHHVIVDVEGRITPPDRDGAAYVLTYICLTSGAPLFEPMRSTGHSDLRRAFFRCAMRAKTWPMLLRSDRGSEFRNALMEELWGLLNFGGRFGSSWRPCEQADAERIHQEFSREMGMLLHSVFRCSPGEWAELVLLLEFILWNSPGQSGVSPRDIVMAWSTASPLERELIPLEAEPVELTSDVATAQFRRFAALRDTFLAFKAQAG